MSWKPAILLLLAAPFLGACERYTEQTSPCFGRNGQPVVSRAAVSLISVGVEQERPVKDCVFEELPHAI